ncbi:MAG: adenylate/guanylate cyclase domain-containing protein, partial [Candidatus Promineifilaceae bacterium]|nr:adenylate/guanylate cyclase domain-containing protein [Candidatus Promineifilaceae bacterium]
MNEREELQKAIASLEAQRAVLGDAVVNTALAALQAQLARLDERDQTAQKRKLATVMFMDMAGHTALIRDLDLEDQLEVVDQALTLLSEPVKAFGGHITRYQGDGFKAVFGLPHGDEHDPDHAIRAALAIQSRAREIAADLEKRWNIQGFQIRVGIDTGMVIAGGIIEGQDSISGPPVNLAA